MSLVIAAPYDEFGQTGNKSLLVADARIVQRDGSATT